MAQIPELTPATAGLAVSGTAAAMWVVLNSINQRKLKALKMLVECFVLMSLPCVFLFFENMKGPGVSKPYLFC